MAGAQEEAGCVCVCVQETTGHLGGVRVLSSRGRGGGGDVTLLAESTDAPPRR